MMATRDWMCQWTHLPQGWRDGGIRTGRALATSRVRDAHARFRPPSGTADGVKVTVNLTVGHGPSLAEPALVLRLHSLDGSRQPVFVAIYAFDSRPHGLRLLDLVDAIHHQPGTKIRHVFGMVVSSDLFQETNTDRRIVTIIGAVSALHQRLGISCPLIPQR